MLGASVNAKPEIYTVCKVIKPYVSEVPVTIGKGKTVRLFANLTSALQFAQEQQNGKFAVRVFMGATAKELKANKLS